MLQTATARVIIVKNIWVVSYEMCNVHKYCFWLLKIAVPTTCIIIQMALTPRMFSRPRVTGLLPSFSLQSWLLDDAFNIHLLSRSSISPPACKLGQWGEAGERESYTQLVHLNIVCPLSRVSSVGGKVFWGCVLLHQFHNRFSHSWRRPLLEGGFKTLC